MFAETVCDEGVDEFDAATEDCRGEETGEPVYEVVVEFVGKVRDYAIEAFHEGVLGVLGFEMGVGGGVFAGAGGCCGGRWRCR